MNVKDKARLINKLVKDKNITEIKMEDGYYCIYYVNGGLFKFKIWSDRIREQTIIPIDYKKGKKMKGLLF